jgi:TolB-like protein/DNA-binding winged helix-turn-helix (wHTH) protein
MSVPPADPPPGRDGGQIDLAATAAFTLGVLQVRPSVRQVLAPDGAELIAEPRVLQVLVALAQAGGDVVSRDTLIARCWDGRITGEDAVNRALAKARHVAELATPPAFVIETIPRVGYRLSVEAADAAPATSEAPAGRMAWPRRALLAAGALAVGAGGFAAYRWLRPGVKTDPLVAVLPFDNLSPDPQLGYFADGLSEDILNALIRGGGMRVTSRTSSFTFRGAGKAKAAQALKADYLLDGSVLREGSRLRVNAHLNDVARQQTLWSETYDRDVGQGLQVEDEVAGKVAAALKVRFAANGPGARLVDPVAYDLYLRGREATRMHEPVSMRQGNELLRSAVALAPDFAGAWLELAKNYRRAGFLEPPAEQREGFELGRQAARRAIALDPRSGAAYGVLGQLTPPFGRWREVDLALAQGLAIAPNDPDLTLWRGSFLAQTGRSRAATDWLRRAQALDPLEIAANHWLCMALTSERRFAEAGAMVARIQAIWPQQIAAYWDQVWLLVGAGRNAEAITMLNDTARRPRGEREEYVVLAQAFRAIDAGSPAERTAAGRALLALSQNGIGYAQNSIMILSRLGRLDEAVELARALYLEKGSIAINRNIQFAGNSRYPPHGEADTTSLFHPFVAPLRRAGRLNEVFDGVGLTAFWRVAGGPDA